MGAGIQGQGEYFRRKEEGDLTLDPFSDRYESRQSGWYAQAVYQFMPRWRAGVRHDRLSRGTVVNAIVDSGAGPTAADFPTLMAQHDPRRNAVMVDWSPTEFSRLRVQLARDESRPDGVKDDQLVLQYIHSLGAHGAHRF